MAIIPDITVFKTGYMGKYTNDEPAPTSTTIQITIDDVVVQTQPVEIPANDFVCMFNDWSGVDTSISHIICAETYCPQSSATFKHNSEPCVYPEVFASDTLRYSDDTEVNEEQTFWEKQKTITFSKGIKGTLRVKFDFLDQEGNGLWARVYKNGVPIGIEAFEDTGYWVTNSEDIDFGVLEPNGTIELWTKGSAWDVYYIRNFRLYYDYVI